MAGNLSVSVTADTSQLRAQLALAQADLRAFGTETKKLANDVRSGADASGALRGQLELAAGQLAGAKANVTQLSAALRDAAGAHHTFSLATAGASRELLVLAHEMTMGNYSRFGGSMMVLGERTNALHAIMSTLLSPIGAVGVAAAAAAAALGVVTYHAIAANNSLQEVHDSLTLMGQGLVTTADDLKAMRDRWKEAFGLSAGEARELLSAFGALPRATQEEKEALAQLAAQIAAVKGADVASVGAELATAFNKGADAVMELGRKYGIEDARAEANIKTLQESGDGLEAVRTAVNALAAAVDAQVGPWHRATAAMKEYIGSWRGLATVMGQGLAGVPITAAGGAPVPPAHPPASGPSINPESAQNQRRLTADLKKEEDDRYQASLVRLRTAIADTKHTQKKIELQKQLNALEEEHADWSETSKAKGDEAIHAIERAKTKGAGHKAAPKEAKDDSNEIELARLSAEQKVDDQIADRRTKLIEATAAAGKISLASEYQLLVDQADQKWKTDQDYYAKKKSLQGNDLKEITKINDEEMVAYQTYLTKKQDLDIKYFEERKAAEKKAADESKAAWDKVLQPLESGFETAIKGFIQGTTTLKQALDRAFETVLLDPLIKNLTNGLKSAFQSAFGDISGGFISKFFSGNLLGGAAGSTAVPALGAASASAAGDVTAFGSAAAGGATNAASSAALTTAITTTGALTDTTVTTAGASVVAAIGASTSAIVAGLAAIAVKPEIAGFSYARGGIVPSAAGGWVVPHFANGGILSVLHQKEMVLPANLSTFVQNAAAAHSGRGGGGNMTYSPTINAHGSTMSGAQFNALLRNNAGELASIAANAHRNGWRP
jgi:hypothetical protein